MVSAHRRQRRARAESGGLPSRRAVLRRLGAALGGAPFLAGCDVDVAVGTTDPRLVPAALAERYARLTLQLAKHQPSLVEAWLGPAAWAEGLRVPVPALRAEAGALAADIERLAGNPVWTSARALAGSEPRRALGPNRVTEFARVAYLLGQIRALDAAAARLLGESQAFADEARRTLGQVPPARDAYALDALRRRLSEVVPGRGTLAERHAAFRRAHAVPADRVEAVFAAAVAWCRASAGALMPLPPGEALTTRAVDESGWAAFSRPTGPRSSDLWVAHRGGADAAHVLQLAAHEGTPGHHAQHVLAMAELADARGWTERALTPAFGPHRLLAEGAAEAGADLLLPSAVRERVCAEVLLPAAGQLPALASRLVLVERLAAGLGVEVGHIARAYLDSSLGSEAVTIRLRDEALVLDPAGMVAFIEKQRAKVLAYPLGRQLVQQALDATPAAGRWGRFTTISTTLTLGE